MKDIYQSITNTIIAAIESGTPGFDTKIAKSCLFVNRHQ
jgi:hypothetical protein